MTWGGSWDFLKRAWQGGIGASRDVVGTGVSLLTVHCLVHRKGTSLGLWEGAVGRQGGWGTGGTLTADVRSCAVGLSGKALTDRGPGVPGSGARWVTSCRPTLPRPPAQRCGSEPRVVPDSQRGDRPWGEAAGSPSCCLSWRVEGDGPGCGG